MASYAEIGEYVRRTDGRGVKPCWIAHVKELNGLNPRVAANRISPNVRQEPCPDWARPLIERAMRHFGMIG